MGAGVWVRKVVEDVEGDVVDDWGMAMQDMGR